MSGGIKSGRPMNDAGKDAEIRAGSLSDAELLR